MKFFIILQIYKLFLILLTKIKIFKWTKNKETIKSHKQKNFKTFLWIGKKIY